MLSVNAKQFLEVLLMEYRKTNDRTINEFIYLKHDGYVILRDELIRNGYLERKGDIAASLCLTDLSIPKI